MQGTEISNLLRVATWKSALLSALALLAAACGKSGTPEGSSTSPADAAPGENAAASATPAPAEGTKALPPPAAPHLQVTLKDLQLFHPYSPDRAMPSVKEDGTVSTRDARQRYGIGLIVEATNETGELLHDAWFEGAVRFTGSNGREIVCNISADVLGENTGARFLSYAPKPPGKAEPGGEFGPKTDWKDESESLLESPWRPSERVRMMTRKNECDAPVADDLGATAIKGRIVVKARKRFVEVYGYDFDDKGFELVLDNEVVRIRDKRASRIIAVPVKDRVSTGRGDFVPLEVVEMTAASGAVVGSPMMLLSHVKLSRLIRTVDLDLVESDPVEFEIHPRAMTLQLVKLPSGEMEHASGNVVIHLKEGKVALEEMARLKMSLLGIERADVPATTPEVAFDADELSGKVTNITLTPSVEDPALVKGQRRLAVTWKLALKSDQIDSRLRSSFDAASAAADTAERAAFTLDMDSKADKAAVAKAKADAASAKAAKTAAETKYKSGLSSESGRLAKLFSCGDARLATNKGVRSPSNGKAASDACKELEKSGAVEVTLSYTLERYEVPVALVYSLAKVQSWKPVASEALLKLDPR